MQVLQPRVLDLNALIADLNKMLPMLIGEEIEYTFRPGESLARVKADPSQIEQVLVNLAVNARDAMPKGGKLTINTRNVLLDAEYARSHPPTVAGATTSCWPWRTRAAAWTSRPRRKFSSRFSPPRSWAKARAWGFPPCTAW